MLQVAYLAHGGQMTGDEMAIVGVGLTGAIGIPLVAMAFIFMNKRSAPEDASEDASDDVAGASAAHETIDGLTVETWER